MAPKPAAISQAVFHIGPDLIEDIVHEKTAPGGGDSMKAVFAGGRQELIHDGFAPGECNRIVGPHKSMAEFIRISLGVGPKCGSITTTRDR